MQQMYSISADTSHSLNTPIHLEPDFEQSPKLQRLNTELIVKRVIVYV